MDMEECLATHYILIKLSESYNNAPKKSVANEEPIIRYVNNSANLNVTRTQITGVPRNIAEHIRRFIADSLRVEISKVILKSLTVKVILA